jgi:(2Fe-2S) ferredoxin
VLPGKTTVDKEFTLETVNCLGACALGPVVVVDGRYYSKVKRTQVKSILKDTLESSGKTVTIDPNAIPVNVSCLRCNHTLMDDKQKIDGKPSIKFTVSFGNTHGSLRLSSLYGSYNIKTELEIPEGKVVDIFCPHCNVELQGAGRCPECNEKMVPLLIRGGGILQFCTKKGCKGHLLDLF